MAFPCAPSSVTESADPRNSIAPAGLHSATCFPIHNYNLAATLTSGQAFRWRPIDDAWEGVIHGRWVRLRQLTPFSDIEATIAGEVSDWSWLTSYLRLNDEHAAILATFPADTSMQAALAHCPGLRLLRQDPWECLASFILSSTKQIVQIQQCVELLCERFGETIPRGGVSSEHRTLISNGGTLPSCRYEQRTFSFPTAERLAAATEAELRDCKMGFRAKYLVAAAKMVCSGELNLSTLSSLPLATARAELMRCPGVGRKIADCVLLFSCGHDEAFPIDVWVERALQQLYFSRCRAKRKRLENFASTHFGPHAGLAQQYLFHYLRTGGSKWTQASNRR